MNNKYIWLALSGAMVLAGCAAPCPSCVPPVAALQPIMQPQPVKLTAIGYGASSSFQGYTPGQMTLMAMRASKLDAYRALAEQVYGVRVTGNSTVSAMAVQNDSFRVYVDSYVRGAKVVSVSSMADGNYETVLELELNPEFYNALNRGRRGNLVLR